MCVSVCVCVYVNAQHMILYTCRILSLGGGGDDNNSGGGWYESDTKRKKGNSILYLWQRIVFRPQRNLLTKANSQYRTRNLVYSVNALQCHTHDILGGGRGEIPYTDRIIDIIIIIIKYIVYIRVYKRVRDEKKTLTFKCSSLIVYMNAQKTASNIIHTIYYISYIYIRFITCDCVRRHYIIL